MAKTLDKPSLRDTDLVARLDGQATGLATERFPESSPYTLEQLLVRELPADALPKQRWTRKKQP